MADKVHCIKKTLRLTPEESKLLAAKAKESDMNEAEYLRLLISQKPKENVFVSMPSYKTKQKDEAGKDIYQDICYPVTKEFREKLYGEIERAYQEAKDKQKEESKDTNSQDKSNDKEEKKDGQAIGSGESLPFR